MSKSSIQHINGLLPFSRDHGVGLVCAQQARRAAFAPQTDRSRLVKQVESVCRGTIIGYLDDEQSVLSPLIGDDQLRASFHERHSNIRHLSAELSTLDLVEHRGLAILSMLADALDDYVRWAQHTLFFHVEDGIEHAQLHELTKQTVKIEAGRNRPTQQLHASIRLPA